MKLEGWKENTMSKAEKEILIKAVVQALPQYAMSIFKIPISVCWAIEQKIITFWWKNQTATKGVHSRKAEILKQRKDRGGLGFRDLISFNKAMLCKQAWQLEQNHTTLCSQVLKGIYYPTKSFWKAEKGSRPSWGWQSILMGRAAIEDAVMWSVGNGQQINIREDKWLKRGRIGGPENEGDPTMVHELLNRETSTWKEPVLRRIFEEQVVHEILTIHIRP